MRLENKVAVITGAGAGIGRACVDLFGSEGAKVVMLERNMDAGQAVCEVERAKGRDCLFIPTDVSEPDAMKDAVAQTMARFGRIDILYNNAGGSTMRDGPVTEAPFDEFWNKMKVDLFGTWLGCHYVIPHMIAAGGGSVINASSVVAIIGAPGMDAYTAAKGAITAMTRSMAVEFAPNNIRVNAIAPGVTATERVVNRVKERGRASAIAEGCLLGVVDPMEIASAVLYLASDESRRTTGHVMVVDSGLTIS